MRTRFKVVGSRFFSSHLLTPALFVLLLPTACGVHNDTAPARPAIDRNSIVKLTPSSVAIVTPSGLLTLRAPSSQVVDTNAMPGQPSKRPAAVVLGIDGESASGRFWGEVVSLFVEPSTPASVNLRLVKSNAMELGGQLVTAEELPQLVGLQDGTAAYQLRFRLPKVCTVGWRHCSSTDNLHPTARSCRWRCRCRLTASPLLLPAARDFLWPTLTQSTKSIGVTTCQPKRCGCQGATT